MARSRPTVLWAPVVPRLSYGFYDGYAEISEAVQDGDGDLELGRLTVQAPRHERRPVNLVPRIFVSSRLRRWWQASAKRAIRKDSHQTRMSASIHL